MGIGTKPSLMFGHISDTIFSKHKKLLKHLTLDEREKLYKRYPELQGEYKKAKKWIREQRKEENPELYCSEYDCLNARSIESNFIRMNRPMGWCLKHIGKKQEMEEMYKRLDEYDREMKKEFAKKLGIDVLDTSPYEILGLKEGATKQEVTMRFNKLAKLLHPDVGGDTHMFRLIRGAYEAIVGFDHS